MTDRRLLLLVPLAALVVWAPGLGGRFLNWDDDWLVEDSPTIRSIDVEAAFDPTIDRTWRGGEYLPLRDLSYAVDFAIWRVNPVGYHLGNLLLFALTALLLSLWIEELGHRRPVAVAAGLLYAVHPMHAESVVWIAGRKDVLCGALFFLGLFLIRRADRAGPAAAAALALLAAAAGVGAMLAKGMGVVFPAAVVAADLVRAARRRWAVRAVVAATGLAAVAASAIHLLVGRRFLVRPYQADPATVAATMAAVALSYLRRLVLPIAPSPLADVPFVEPTAPAALVGAALLAIGAAWLILALARRRRLAEGGRTFLLAGLLLIVTLAPFSNVVPFRHLLADRYLFLPSAALCLALGHLLARPGGRRTALLLAAVAAPLAVLSVRQARLWGDPLALYGDALGRDPDNHFLHLLRGESLAEIDHPGAGPALERAVSTAPRSTPHDPAEAHLALAVDHLERGRIDEAEAAYRAAIAASPTRAVAWAGLGNCLKARRRWGPAREPFERAMVLEPDDPSYPAALAGCHYQLGDRAAARRWFARALAVDGRWYLAAEGLAALDRADGDLASAARHLAAALAVAPDNPRLHLSAAEVAIEDGRLQDARHHVEAARAMADVDRGRLRLVEERLDR